MEVLLLHQWSHLTLWHKKWLEMGGLYSNPIIVVATTKEMHFKKLLPIKELCRGDARPLMPLPGTPFDVCRYQ